MTAIDTWQAGHAGKPLSGPQIGLSSMGWLRVALVVVFLTALYRIFPLPISDTYRAVFLSALVFVVSLKTRNTFFVRILPFVSAIALCIFVDLIMGRFGRYAMIVWTQFAAVLLVGSIVYGLGASAKKRVVFLSLAVLIALLFVNMLLPQIITSAASRLGVVDPFVSHGRSFDRFYYLYFNANAAAYTAYFMLLSTLAIDRVSPLQTKHLIAVLLGFVALIFYTGGRASIFLAVGAIVGWLLTFRSNRVAFVGLFVVAGWSMLAPLYELFRAAIGLRAESNEARFNALLSYFDLIAANPVFGAGFDYLRERVSLFGLKPSHNFFVELVGAYGFVLGGFLIVWLILELIVRQPDNRLKVIGLFGLIPSFFNNTLLTNWGFIPLFLPVMLWSARQVRRSQADERAQRSPPLSAPRSGPNSGQRAISPS
ncbi:MAG: hypothetical protein AAGA34_06670 [Pseudomonadota bacterium]